MAEFQFKCPQCGQTVETEEYCRGQVAECPYCGKGIVVPSGNMQADIQRKGTKTTRLLAMVTTVARTAMNKIVALWKNDKRWCMLFAAISAMMIIQLIMLHILIFNKGTIGSVSDTPHTIMSMSSGTPSELLLKYTEQGESSYVAAVLRQNPSLDINRLRTTGNKTVLYLACENGYSDIVELLLKQKADTTICSHGGYSPLTISARNGHLAVVKVLLKSGVNIEARDDEDRTALYAAAAGNKPDVVRFLCESNAKVNIMAKHNSWSPLGAAAHEGYTEVVKVLLKYGKGIDLETRIKGNTALFIAVEENQPDIVRLLCESNARVNIYGGLNGSWTPLTIAASEGFTDVVEVLLNCGKGIDLEMPTKWGDTPLKSASSKKRDDVVKVLEKYKEERKNQKQGRAIEHLRKAAEQGNAKAQFDLAVCYAGGDGVVQDKSEVAKWLRKSAEQGYAEAQCCLGHLYANGVGVDKDKTEAVKWIRKAAEQNHPLALCNLANCYVAGDGVTQDFAQAVRLYRKSAELGLAEAQFQLGVCHANGVSVSQDWHEAVKWYRKAAEQNHSKAQLALGLCYQFGYGVPQNAVEADMWISEAKKNPQVQEQIQGFVNSLKH